MSFHSYVSLPEGNDMLKLFEFLPELNHQYHTCLRLHGIIRVSLQMRLARSNPNPSDLPRYIIIFLLLKIHGKCTENIPHSFADDQQTKFEIYPMNFSMNKIQSSKLSSIVYQCVYIYIHIMHWFYSFIFIHSLLDEIFPWYPLVN